MFKLYNGHCGMRKLNYRETFEHIGARLLESERHELIAGSMQRTLPDGSTCCCATGCPTNGGEERYYGSDSFLYDEKYNVLFNRSATNVIMGHNDMTPAWRDDKETFSRSMKGVTTYNEAVRSRENRFYNVIGFLVEQLTKLDKETLKTDAVVA